MCCTVVHWWWMAWMACVHSHHYLQSFHFRFSAKAIKTWPAIRCAGQCPAAQQVYAVLSDTLKMRIISYSTPINSKWVLCGYGTFLQQLECGYRFPALIHVWIASAGVLELFISTSGEATSACKPFWHNGWGNSGMNECRKSIPTQELLQENHSLMFWQFGKFHISTSAQKLSCYIFLYPTLIWQVFIC